MKRRITILMDDVRAYLRNLSIGLFVGGVLTIAIAMPNWYGLYPFAGGIVCAVFGCVKFEEAD